MSKSGNHTDILNEYVGTIHIHSNFSDGLRPIPEIVDIAKKFKLDILMFADHMTLKPVQLGLEGWYGDTLAIIGYEHNDLDNKNHYLAFGVDEVMPPDMPATEYVREIDRQGGTGFIAHPDEKRNAISDYPPYPWTAWNAEGYHGIEIWNHSSEWMEKLTHFNKYYRVLHPLRTLEGPEKETLERWDRLNQLAPMPGIGGIDAHAYPYQIGPLTIYIFRYKVLFRGIRTHILVEGTLSQDGAEAKAAVLDALRRARCFISNFRWGDARGFRFEARTAGGSYFVGDSIQDENAEFVVSTPLPGVISLLRDGEKVAVANGNSLSYTATKTGAYRVEVARKNKQWIFSNHIRLLTKKDGTD